MIAAPVKTHVGDPGGANTSITADPGSNPFTQAGVKIRLNVALQQLCPPGWPAPPSQVGVAGGGGHFPKTIPAGTVITEHNCTALALIAAGLATAV